MSITCKICCQSFEKIIPWQHLKTHGIASADYKKKFGNLYSDQTLNKFKSRTPHNKGKKVTDPEALNNIRTAVALREERFKNKEFARGTKCSDEKKKILSLKTKQYAQLHPEELKTRAEKAIKTKIKNNYDFGQNMRGKTHSQETKNKIKQYGKLNNKSKIEHSHKTILENISLSNLTLINSLDKRHLNLLCNYCNHCFSFTKQYFQNSKFRKDICPACFPRHIIKSKGEKELYDFIKSLDSDAVNNYRIVYHSKEIDVFIPSKNIGFEFNGLYWHSETVLTANGRPATSDYEKYRESLDNGIRIYQIFEDEWKNKQQIVKDRITNILGKTSKKIFARNCRVNEINSKTSSTFCNQYHIMGNGRSNIRLGLFYKDQLISVMTFSNNNLSRKVKSWEINRFVSIGDTHVVGGASKLFNHFLKMVNPNTVVSYADNRWSEGKLYSVLGFEKVSEGTPNYWYFLPNDGNRIHRFSLRKTQEDNQTLTEYQNRLNQGYLRIWDFGSSKWVWKNKHPN